LTNRDNAAGSPRRKAFVQRYARISSLDRSRGISLFSAVGLSLLYASAYCLPALAPMGIYFLPSRDLVRLVILPGLVAVATGSIAIYAISALARKWFSSRMIAIGAVVALWLLALIGVKGAMNAAGFDWENAVPRGHELLTSLRDVKAIAALVVFALVWLVRAELPKLNRGLASLGFALGVLAAVRLFLLWSQPQQTAALSAAAAAPAMHSAQGNSATAGAKPMTPYVAPRRVVWVIFDETDFRRVYPSGAATAAATELRNFNQLARSAVFATDANSPASATLYSIPALLTGEPLGGDGVRIDRTGSLLLERPDATEVRFAEAASIFGTLATSGRGASVLGFYHPYCKIFRLQRCDSFPYPDVGGLDAALLENIPEFILTRLRRADYWDWITRRSLELLPQYLARDDALTFVHLNVPHLPAAYADQKLHLPASSDPLIEYSHNLLLADRILGDIVHDLQEQAPRHETLLVISTDHWLRNRWYRANERESSRPVVFIAWKVGDSKGIVLPQPLSTVHTAAMILDYLNGKISTQADIAQWWVGKPVYPSYIAPNS
jgi:hypothetical protein